MNNPADKIPDALLSVTPETLLQSAIQIARKALEADVVIAYLNEAFLLSDTFSPCIAGELLNASQSLPLLSQVFDGFEALAGNGPRFFPHRSSSQAISIRTCLRLSRWSRQPGLPAKVSIIPTDGTKLGSRPSW